MKPQVVLAAAFLALFSVVQCRQITVDDDLNSDRQALLEFDASVHHVRNFGWNVSVPVCSWFGITCRKDDHGRTSRRVVALRLPGVGLYGVLRVDTSIARLDALRVLSLRSNRLSGEIPSAINNLTRLSVLNLQFNSFSGAIPDLNSMPKLRNLNVSHNLLSGTIPESCRKFPVSSFVGNSPLLCGPPLATTCNNNTTVTSPSPPPPPSEHTSRKQNVKSRVALVIGGSSSVAFLVMFAAIVFCCFCLKKKKKKVTEGGSSAVTSSAVTEKPEPNDNELEKNKLVWQEKLLLYIEGEDDMQDDRRFEDDV